MSSCPPLPLGAGELHTGKHSQVCHYLDTRTGQLVAVKTYYKRTMAKRHYRNVRREIAISRLLAKQRWVLAGCSWLSLAAAPSLARRRGNQHENRCWLAIPCRRFTGAVQLLGAFEDDGHIYLVQEQCAGAVLKLGNSRTHRWS